MTGQELLTFLRTDVLRDSVAPYLWSDTHILRMLNAAERDFCTNTYALLDDGLTVTTAASTMVYALPASVLYVDSAAINGYPHDMGNYTRRFLSNNLATSTGTPQVFTCDESLMELRLYPVPDAVYTVNLRISRLPTADFTTVTSPEIPARYHLALADYAAWKLLLSNDVDGGNVGASDRHRKDYLQRVSDAKREYYRLRTGNNANARSSCTWKRN